MQTGMNIVTLSIASREEVSRRAAAALRGDERGRTSRSNRSALGNPGDSPGDERPRRIVDPRGSGRVGRDVKAVHGGVTALLHAETLDQAEAGVVFPYGAVRVDLTLTNAA